MSSGDYASEYKVPAYSIRSLSNQSEGFYETLGPMLSRREIVKELGGPVWDDDEKQWWVAVTNEGEELLGSVAYYRSTICSFYVFPQARNKSVGAALLFYALARIPEQPSLRAIATEASFPLFEAFGFEKVGTKGSFQVMERGGIQ